MLHHHKALKGVNIPLPRSLPEDTRQALEAAIQRHQAAMDGLIAVLDLFDCDSDLEPSLGAHLGRWYVEDQNQEQWASSPCGDLEIDVADEPHDEADEGNDEPSLAHTLDVDQTRAQFNAVGRTGTDGTTLQQDMDFEGEHDGCEPSLGAMNPNPNRSQEGWAEHGEDDCFARAKAGGRT